ncbi:choice-of-anchor D domain-containing protein [Myxococcota bacterium]|nr:choice-of-anchor D domain-containing protein [Myxococcota bacterium]
MSKRTLLIATALTLAACSEAANFRRVAAELRVEPLVLDLGEVLVGVETKTAVTVRSVGTSELRLCADSTATECEGEATRVEPPMARADLRGVEDDGTWRVPAGASRQLVVVTTPAAEGAFAATLVLAHDGSNGPTVSLPISGTAVRPHVSVNADHLDFGFVPVGAKKELTLVITNETGFVQPVSITTASDDGVDFGTIEADGADTAPLATMTAQLTGHGTTTVRAWFQPIDEGARAGTLTIRYCTTCELVLPLAGTGTKPSFALSPSALDFGTLDVGVAAMRAFDVVNGGASPVTVLDVALESESSEFTVTPRIPVPFVLDSGARLTVDARYVGTSPSSDTGRVRVTTDGFDDPTTALDERVAYLPLTALSTGPLLAVSPANVAFGTVNVGEPASRRIVVENAGNASLQISSITISSGAPELVLSSQLALPRSLAAGESLDVELRYTPSAPGADTGALVVRSTDRQQPMLTIPVSGTGALPNVCVVDVAPNPLTFGLVARGRTARMPVHLRAAGGVACTISGLRIQGSPELTITSGAVAQVTIAPGDAHALEITYSPTAYGNHAAQLTFTSNDPAMPTAVIPLSGSSAPTDLLVVPAAVDFNLVPVGCRSPTRTVTLYNTGSNTITVQSTALDATTSPEYSLSPLFSPTVIPAGGSATMTVRYAPNELGVDTGVIFVTSDAAAVPIAVPLSGRGEVNPVVTDNFQQVPSASDVLFVIDNSGSMAEEQAGIGSNLASFLAFAQSNGLDYQIGVVTTDVENASESGRFVGSTRVLTPGTANVTSVFATNVNQGTSGSGNEQGLEAAYRALSDPLINTHNAGFLRPDAMLSIVIVSDEEDQSPRTRQFYEGYFLGLKGPGNESRVSVSAIVGLTNPECTSANGVADYAPRYIRTAEATGGVTESICAASWGTALQNIGYASFGLRRRFTLSSAPVEATIEVRVNGVVVPRIAPNGTVSWTWDAAAGAVVFQPAAAPGAWATIAITYSVACL